MLTMGVGAYVRVDDVIWFTPPDFNGLFKYHINTSNIEFVYRFACVGKAYKQLFRGEIIYYKGQLFLFPYQFNKIVVYSIDEQKEQVIEIHGCLTETFGTPTIVQKDSKVYFGGTARVNLFCLDLETKQVKKINSNMLEKHNEAVGVPMEVCDERYVISVREKNSFIEIMEGNEREVEIPDELKKYGLSFVSYWKGHYWISVQNSRDIFSWDMEKNIVERYESVLPYEEEVPYIRFLFWEDEILLLSRLKCDVYSVNLNNKTVEVLCSMPIGIMSIRDGIGMSPWICYGMIKDKLWLFPQAANQVLVYDKEERKLQGIPLKIDVNSIPDWIEILGNPLKEGTIELVDMLQYIVNR